MTVVLAAGLVKVPIDPIFYGLTVSGFVLVLLTMWFPSDAVRR